MASILIIDDGALLTSWLSEILRREGHIIETAKNEKDALELHNEHLHDLIVADLKSQAGLEMVAELVRRTPHAQILAIIGGDIMESNCVLNKANTNGNVRLLRKPFSIDSFLKTVISQLPEA